MQRYLVVFYLVNGRVWVEREFLTFHLLPSIFRWISMNTIPNATRRASVWLEQARVTSRDFYYSPYIAVHRFPIAQNSSRASLNASPFARLYVYTIYRGYILAWILRTNACLIQNISNMMILARAARGSTSRVLVKNANFLNVCHAISRHTGRSSNVCNLMRTEGFMRRRHLSGDCKLLFVQYCVQNCVRLAR